jgi:predicted PurR-regulated permease PerM
MTRKTEAERVSQLVFYGTVFLIAWLAWRIVQPFLVEIAWAVVLAICLDPLRVRLLPRLGPTRTALSLTLAVVVLLVIPVVFVGTAVVAEGGPAVRYLEDHLRSQGGAADWFHQGWEWARARAPFLPTEQEAIARVTASVGKVAEFLAAQAGGILKGAANFLFSLVITMGVLFFMVRDGAAFQGAIRRVLPFGDEQNERLLALTGDLVSASVTATLAIAALQGLIGGVTFALLGVDGWVLWGAMMGILALLPLVGATIVWLPAAAWLALSGSLVKGIVLAAVGVVVLGNVDNVVRPLLLSGKSQMNTLVLIISLMGGVSAFGFIGIVIGPLVAALLTALVESYAAPAPAPAPSVEPPVAASPGAPPVGEALSSSAEAEAQAEASPGARPEAPRAPKA